VKHAHEAALVKQALNKHESIRTKLHTKMVGRGNYRGNWRKHCTAVEYWSVHSSVQSSTLLQYCVFSNFLYSFHAQSPFSAPNHLYMYFCPNELTLKIRALAVGTFTEHMIIVHRMLVRGKNINMKVSNSTLQFNTPIFWARHIAFV
jgi:hypothetical protein